MPEDKLEVLRALTTSYLTVLTEIENKKATIKTLRALVFGARTEKKENVAGSGKSPKKPDSKNRRKNKQEPKGHGRNGAKDYPGAERVTVQHLSLRPGDSCLSWTLAEKGSSVC